MYKYRKKPIVIEAFQMTKKRRWDNSEWPNWLNMAWNREPGENALWPNPDAPPNPEHESPDELLCGTPGRFHSVAFGDYIVQSARGEIYTISKDLFKKTYEKV